MKRDIIDIMLDKYASGKDYTQEKAQALKEGYTELDIMEELGGWDIYNDQEQNDWSH